MQSYLLFFCFSFLLLFLFRAAFWAFIATVQHADAPLSPAFWKGFYIGLRFDARIAALFTLPLGAALSVPALFRRMQKHSALVGRVYFAFFFLLFSVYALDMGFYLYLGVRLNSTLFELLQDTGDALLMVWQSYPVIPLALAVIALSAACAAVFRRIAARPLEPPVSRKRLVSAWLAGFTLFALAVYGQISSNFFPLRWSNAYFSPDSHVIALALNPLQNVYDTFVTGNKANYDLKALKADYGLLAAFLGVDEPDPENLNFARKRGSAPKPGEKRPNVVIIVMESLAYPKTSFAPDKLGSGADPTPFLVKLGKESAVFHQFYANARTTARAVFTLVTGIPDVTEGSTGSRNPFITDQKVIANDFDGYDKFYMIGGSTSWANIRAVLSHNVTGLKILEEGSWKAPNVDVWGISDADLFREAHEVLNRASGRPFLAVVQTAGYHRPYTIPDEENFPLADPGEKGLSNYGFTGEDEYNSMRFADFALSEFFRLAKAEPWYDDTIFFIFGDHGLNDPSENTSASYKAAGLEGWHVPLLIHAPSLRDESGNKLVTEGNFNTPCGTADIFATAADLAGVPHRNTTLGRSIYGKETKEEAAVLISGNSGVPIHLVQDGYCFFDNRLGQSFLYRLDDENAKNYAEEEPERYGRMRRLGLALDNAARYMLYHNRNGGS